MKITIVMDGRFEWAFGLPCSSHMAYQPFVTRFLDVFDHVEICARAYDTEIPSGAPLTGPGASFIRIGTYRGARAFFRQLPGIARNLWRLSGSPDPVIAYLPGTLSIIFGVMRLLRGKPLYALVVADPADQLGAGALDHPLRRFARATFVTMLKALLWRSNSAMYVTRFHLQKHYPLRSGRQGFATSDVYIPDAAFVPRARTVEQCTRVPRTLIYVAMMAQAYKGHDDLIKAFAIALARVPDLRLVMVGDGPLRSQFEAMARDSGVAEKIVFAGKLAHGRSMTEALDGADMFVMPSRAEGLPRALIEAMARGLPALSTNVGGIGELLAPEFLVAPNDHGLFAERLTELLGDPRRLAAMSAQNLKTARTYGVAETTGRMKAFYRHIRDEADHAA